MRKVHRWLAVLAGLFVLWIAVTGVLTQGARMVASTEPRPVSTAAAGPPRAEAPRPPQSPTRKFIHFVTDLHSGEQFGLVGQIISLLAGLALVFFAISGMWMYLQMFRARRTRAHDGKANRGGKWFW